MEHGNYDFMDRTFPLLFLSAKCLGKSIKQNRRKKREEPVFLF
uniref:Uncharacterized protein n=1 Tax=Utricularia reniformis TaxID=192314 RepID=A0A1Y0B2I5_9LAMI|nr:hypothetical protein AEK19_MT1413 [Utricularia reniformis]ART31607.1 hypothetical protein AEK19_MT1413 [Utricularia reniformis]